MGSLYLNRLDQAGTKALRSSLHTVQQGKCFICQKPIDLMLHADSLDIDHVEPLSSGGKDDQTNFALTHAHCNRSKQASDLRVARLLSRFDAICDAAEPKDANLGHVLQQHGGALFDLPVGRSNGSIRLSFPDVGRNDLIEVPVVEDMLSRMGSIFVHLPIEYLHHDDEINPRPIGKSLRGLVEEFHRGNPQLHIGLGWIDLPKPDGPQRAKVRVFDGQHKIAAQVLLGVRSLPVRVFVDPDKDRLLSANTNAGTTLRQVAFDKSVQRRLGGTILLSRIERFRSETGRGPDDWSFSERDLVKHFRGEARAVQRYVLDNVRNAITHHTDNHLRDFIEFAGKGSQKPFSYSSIEKTFYSFFINQEMLETPWDWKSEVDANPREIEKQQIIRLMNLIADTIYMNHYDPERGTDRLESKLQKGEDIPPNHLRAFRMAKEEILYSWLKYVRAVIQQYFITQGQQISDDKLFQTRFPEPLWANIQNFVRNLGKLPLWVDQQMSITVFGGKLNHGVWETIFQTGSSPQGQRVLAEPLNTLNLIRA